MEDHPGVMTIEAELVAPTVTVQIARFDVTAGQSQFVQDDDYRLDLSLTPRAGKARLSFQDHWSAHRFERLGRIFVVPPGQTVHARTDGGRQSSVVCLMRPDAVHRWLEHDIDWSGPHIDACLDIPGAGIEALLTRLGDEARRPGFASEALCEAIGVHIAIELGRYYIGIDSALHAGGLQPWRLQRIEERIRDAPTAPTLSELATLCDLSVRQLTRGFRESRGRSIGAYIAERRLERACELLERAESVKSVAYAMGFGSPSNFSQAFRRATGRTPQQYRHAARS